MDEALEDTRVRFSIYDIERGIRERSGRVGKNISTQTDVARRPEVGLINDQLPKIQAELKQMGVELVLWMRTEDLEFQAYGTAGFFGFRKKIEPEIRAMKGLL
jgi:hypothetical protein